MEPSIRTGRLAGMIAAAAVMALTGGAMGQEGESGLRVELEALKAEVAELRAERASEDETWLDERRAEEVRTLIDEVMADAETRGGVGAGNFTAGYDGGFYISSADGAYLLKLGAHFQPRYIANFRNDSGEDDVETGFQLRRAKFKFNGHIGDPTIRYAFSLAAFRGRESVVSGVDFDGDAFSTTGIRQIEFEDYYIEYEFADGWSVRGGRWKQPFARENIISSSRQLAVERSAVHETFRVDRSEGVMLAYRKDAFSAYGSLNDGQRAGVTDFHADDTDFAVTARGEVLLAGQWEQFKDFNAWSDDPMGLMLGAATHYEVGETGDLRDNDNFLRWTADLSFEQNGLNLFLAGYGEHDDNESAPEFDEFGFEAMAGYMIVPDTFEPFVRYERIMPDSDRVADTGDVNLISAGFNWYQKRHNAKFTLDVIWAMDPLRGITNRSSGLGLRTDAPGEDDQTAIRAQYQLAF